MAQPSYYFVIIIVMVIADRMPYICFATDTLKKLSPPLNAAVYAMTIFTWLGVYYGQHWHQTNRRVTASAKEDNIEESLLLLYCILVYNIHYTCVCVQSYTWRNIVMWLGGDVRELFSFVLLELRTKKNFL